MKETNMEHFRSEIEAFISAKGHFGKSKADGTINHCHIIGCDNCDFIEKGMSCDTGTIKWLMSEYKPEPVLTAREKGFVECIAYGWMTRDEDNCLMWHEEQPWIYSDRWDSDENHMYVNAEYFPFITWEGKTSWSVEELRKLKVENAD